MQGKSIDTVYTQLLWNLNLYNALCQIWKRGTVNKLSLGEYERSAAMPIFHIPLHVLKESNLAEASPRRLDSYRVAFVCLSHLSCRGKASCLHRGQLQVPLTIYPSFYYQWSSPLFLQKAHISLSHILGWTKESQTNVLGVDSSPVLMEALQRPNLEFAFSLLQLHWQVSSQNLPAGCLG